MQWATQVLAVALLTGGFAAPASAALLNYEYGAVQGELGQVRVLAERISKRHLLSELNLGDQQRIDVDASVAEMESLLRKLRAGDPLGGVPRPPNDEIRHAIVRLDQAWAPLRQMALVSPYNYLRQSGGYMKPTPPREDAQHFRHFDRVALQVSQAAEAVSLLYDRECRRDGYSHCDLVLRQGFADMLTERLVKQAVLVFSGIDPETTREDLVATRDTYDRMGEAPQAQRLVEQVTASQRGSEGALMGQLLAEINASWTGLRRRIDRVIEGIAEEEDIRQAVRLQDSMVAHLHRFTMAVTHFARIEQGGQGTRP